MKRIISIVLFALVILPAAVNADSTNPIIKIKSTGAVLINGTGTIEQATLNLTEGQTVTLTVELGLAGGPNNRRVRLHQNFTSANPTNTYNPDVTVDAGSRDIFEDHPTNPERFGYRANNAHIQFTNNNWNQPVDLVIGAAHDDDMVNDTYRIQIPVFNDDRSYIYIGGTITDVPSGTIQVTPGGTLTIDEEASANLSVSLSAQPNADVTVSLAKTNGDVTLSPTSLTFTTANWNSPQTVTVQVRHDDDDGNETDTITLSATGGISAPDVTKAVSITDNDEVEFILTTTTLTLTEGGSGTFGMRPGTRPSANITVTITASDSSKVAIDTDPDTPGNQNTLNFARYGQTNAWNRYRTVTVTALQNNDTNGATITITATGAGGDYQGKTATVTTTILPQGNIVLAPTRGLMFHEGGSASFFVRLSAQPVSDVIVSLAKTNADVTLSRTSITITTSNWDTTAFQVTVSAARDTDSTTDTDTITLSATGGISAPDVTKAVTITDDDPSNKLGDNPISLSYNGNQVTFSVRALGFDGTIGGSTEIHLIYYALTDTTGDCSFNLPHDRFTGVTAIAGNANYSRTITGNEGRYICVLQQEETIDSSDDAYHYGTAGPISYPLPTGTINVSPAGTLTIDEGASGNLSVSLSTEPDSDVTISLAKTNADVTLTPTSLTFTTANWDTSQTVSVSAAQDADTTDDSDTITLTATGGIDASSVTKAVTITDDGVPPPPPGAIVVTYDTGKFTLNTPEGGTNDFFVRLSAEPSSNVTVTLTKTNAEVSLSPTTLTFTTANWNTAQTVTITVAEDADAEHDSDTITLSASGGIAAADVTEDIRIADNEVGWEADVDKVVVIEGSTTTFNLRLTTQPKAGIFRVETNVGLSSPSVFIDTNDQAAGFQTTLHIARDSWDTYMPITVTANEDANQTHERLTIDLLGNQGSGRWMQARGALAVEVIDNDGPAPTITGITRQTPATSPTNADSLTWRVSFSEAVSNVNNADFTVSGDSGSLGSPTLSVARDGTTNNWDVTVSGGNLNNYNGTVTLGLDSSQNITGSAGTSLSSTLPGDAANTYVLDNTAPSISDVSRRLPATSPTSSDTLSWRVTFDETLEGLDAADFIVSGDSGSLGGPDIAIEAESTVTWRVNVSGGNLAGYNGVVTLGLDSSHNITDSAGNAVISTLVPSDDIENTYTVDNTAPTVVDASVNGTTLTVTFSETMDSTKASDSAWAVSVAGNSVSVSSYTLSDNTAILTLASAVVGGDAVTPGLHQTGQRRHTEGHLRQRTGDIQQPECHQQHPRHHRPDRAGCQRQRGDPDRHLRRSHGQHQSVRLRLGGECGRQRPHRQQLHPVGHHRQPHPDQRRHARSDRHPGLHPTRRQ